MGLFNRINQIDQQIEELMTITETVSDDVKDSFYESEIRLYKEKYNEIQNAKEELDHLYEFNMIDSEMYEKASNTLDTMESETEMIAYPYMTEAAKAINTVLADTELKEYKSSEAKHLVKMNDKKMNVADIVWLRARIKRLSKINSKYILLGKFKKEKIEEKEAYKLINNTPENTKLLYAKKFKSDDNTVIGIVYEKDNKISYFMQSTKNSDFYCLCLALVTRYANFIDNHIISECMKQWNDYKKSTDKEIKESVLLEGKMDEDFNHIDMAVQDGVISQNMANYYKEYVTTLYEKENLLYSLEDR